MGPCLGLNVFYKIKFWVFLKKWALLSKTRRFSKNNLRFLNGPLNLRVLEVGSYRRIATHIALHIHIVTHARFSRFTYGTLVQPVTVCWGWEVNIVIKHTNVFILWTHIIEQSLGGSPFIPDSSAETSLWISQKSIKKYTKTRYILTSKLQIFFSGWGLRFQILRQLGALLSDPRRPVIQTFQPRPSPFEIPAYAAGKNT